VTGQHRCGVGVLKESEKRVTAIRVRRVRPAEWATLRAVRLAALADAPAAFGSTTARELAFGEADWRRRASTAPNFIAWRGDEPVGLVTLVSRGGGEPGRPAEWELASMWVSPDARGSGAADLLVSAVTELVRAESADHLVLWVADGNARARAFYLRAGFRPAGVRQTYRRHDGSAFEEEKLVMPLALTE
jgi:ribosomal protein S18 acetylase RimI-like enzyme